MSTFTCEAQKVYIFMFSVLKTLITNGIYVSMYKDDNRTMYVHDNTAGYHQLNTSTTMWLEPNNNVYLSLNSEIHDTQTANVTS